MSNPFDKFDTASNPFDAFDEEETSFAEDAKIGLANAAGTVHRWMGNLAGGAMSAIGATDEADRIYKEVDEDLKRIAKEANPKGKKQSFGGKAVGMLATLPAQLIAFPFGPATTGTTMVDNGETTGTAVAGTLADTIGNVAGVAIPGAYGTNMFTKAVTGAGANALQDLVTRLTISGISDKEQTKKELGPSAETVGLSALLGGAMGPMVPSTTKTRKPSADTVLRQAQEQGLTGKDITKKSPMEMTNELAQYQLFDQPEMGRVANPYEAKLGDWRVDENGIPIKADLSMEVQNLQNPLQRNLWGDELDPVRNPVGQNADLFAENGLQQGTALTDAIDALTPKERTQVLDQQFKHAVEPSGALEWAILEATPQRINRVRGPARGGIDPDLLTLGIPKLLDKVRSPEAKAKLEKLFDTKLFQEATTYEQIKSAADTMPPEPAGNVLSRGTTYFGAGGSLEALKRNNPIVLGVSRIVQRAKNIAENHVRDNVFPVESSLRQVKRADIPHLAEFMKQEQLTKTRLGVEELIARGATLEEAQAYRAIRDMSDGTYKYLNDILESIGQQKIKYEPAYMASLFKGQHKRSFSVDGRIIHMVAADSKRGLELQTKAVLKQFPELKNAKMDDIIIRQDKFGRDAAKVFKDMVELLGSDDPAIKAIRDWAGVQEEAVAKSFGGEEKRFIPKDNVRGFVGDRSANTLSGKLNPTKEAVAYMQAQVDAAKMAYQWGELQKAAQELKKLFSDAELAEKHPQAVNWAKEYWLDNIGLSNSEVSRAIDNTIRKAGLSTASLERGINTIKGLWITQKILSIGYIISNGLQYANTMPHLADISAKYGGNPVKALAYGTSVGPMVALGHKMHSLGVKGSDKALYQIAQAIKLSDFDLRAMKYAEDNSVTTRSIYDEAPIESSYGVTGKLGSAIRQFIGSPETLLRSMVYMTYVKMLESSGKFKNDLDIFRQAEERVNASMGDYRMGERAMVFSKLGTLGTATNTLSTFPMNYFNQWSWVTREAGRGNMAPFVAMFLTQGLVAGVAGVPMLAEIDKQWENLKDVLKEYKPEMWAKLKDISILKFVQDTLGNVGLYGAASVATGTHLSPRAAAPQLSEMAETPIAPVLDFATQAGSLLSAAASIDDPQKWAQAALDVAPTGLKGPLETGLLKDYTSVPSKEDGVEGRTYGKITDIASNTGQVFRTPEQENIRKWGLKSLEEVVKSDAARAADKRRMDTETAARSIADKFYNAAKTNNKEKARELFKLHAELTGREITEDMIVARAIKANTTPLQRSVMNVTSVEGMLAIKRAKDIINEFKKEEVQ